MSFTHTIVVCMLLMDQPPPSEAGEDELEDDAAAPSSSWQPPASPFSSENLAGFLAKLKEKASDVKESFDKARELTT